MNEAVSKAAADTAEELLLTTAEAVALIKRAEREKGTKFYVLIPLNAGVVGKKDIIYPGGCSTSLELSRAEAIKMASDMLSETLEARGGRIRMTKRVWVSPALGTRVSYWFD